MAATLADLSLRALSPATHGSPFADALARGAAQTTEACSAARIDVVPVTKRRHLRDFIDFPWQIYAGDAAWAPPLKREAAAFLDRKRHPFYQHGDAVALVAYRDGQVVGRILAADDPNFNAAHGDNTGTFGLFESIDDVQVAQALLNKASDWLRARGRTRVMGPVDYSTNYPAGLLIDGFETPPRIMMNHQPRYYAGLLEGCGLTKAKDLYAWWFDDSLDILTQWKETAERLARRSRVVIRPVRMDDFDAEVQRCMEVYNLAWQRNWGFVKMTRAELEHLAQQIRQFAAPELILLAEVDGRPVGVSMTLPDINEAIRPLNGRLTTWGLPIGLAKLAWNLRKIRAARMAVLGTIEGYRKRGIAELLILRTLEVGKHKLGYTGAELGWTLEDNTAVNRTIEGVGARRYKTYRVYERGI